jgi:hypothetical protein
MIFLSLASLTGLNRISFASKQEPAFSALVDSSENVPDFSNVRYLTGLNRISFASKHEPAFSALKIPRSVQAGRCSTKTIDFHVALLK